MTDPITHAYFSSDSHAMVPGGFLGRLLSRLASTPGLNQAIADAARETLLTVYEAADIAQVTPRRISAALDENAIPHTAAGAHRLIRYSDLLAWMREDDARRQAAADALTRFDQED